MPSCESSSPVSELPAIVDVEWLQRELGADDLVLGDVRGPNAHARGHIPGSRPLVLGSPPPMSDAETVQALASEVALRLRRHGITGEERLGLDDPGLVLLDVRTEDEFAGRGGYPCDPRQGHIPGARRLGVEELFGAPGRPRASEEVRALVDVPGDADVVAYCHSGSRSARAT